MEGAALHFIGNLEDIRYLQLRALSNYIGERDKKKWLLKEAINELNKELERLLNKLEVI
jgi:futalosine hydrolase